MGEGHPLEHAYTMSIFKRPAEDTISTHHDYMRHVKTFATVKTVEEFWRVYSHMIRVDQLRESARRASIHVFKEGIDPVWEVPENRLGGQFIIKCRRSETARIWENVLLAMLGEQFMVGDELTGAVCMIHEKRVCSLLVVYHITPENRIQPWDTVALWNRHRDQEGLKKRIRHALYRIANIPASQEIEYRPHFD